MVSDSVLNASISNVSKDFAKKKRAKRSAKLKQCKLDARREQWLSQVKKKGCKEGMNNCGDGREGEFNEPVIETCKKATHRCEDLEMQSQVGDDNNGSHHDSDLESPAPSPTGNNSGNSYTGTSSSSSSSGSIFSSGGSFSGSLSEEEEGGGDNDDCLDDWEAVADALSASDDKQGQNPDANLSAAKETVLQSDTVPQLGTGDNVVTGWDKSQSEAVGIVARSEGANWAWRPNDAFRPQSLPNLTKQASFPVRVERHFGHTVNPWDRNFTVSVPTSCPICCEDLDMTDTSFLPCSCGFRLCLFCHKRILEEDGRCPGCRKPYDSHPVVKETSVSGGSLMIRLARSQSMFSRA